MSEVRTHTNGIACITIKLLYKQSEICDHLSWGAVAEWLAHPTVV